jgi:hypothetical protein
LTDGFIKAELPQLVREGKKRIKSSTQKKNEFPLMWAQFPWNDRWFQKIGVFQNF